MIYITTFASKSFERKNTFRKVAELQVIKRTRDLFGRLPDLSGTNNIDLESVLSFPILPKPTCFASTAVTRWVVTASMKSKILNVVLDYADMNICYNELKESRVSRITAEQNHLSKLEKVIKSRVNPFSKQLNKDFLFNIKTGTQPPKKFEKYLLTLLKCGEEKRDVFAFEFSTTFSRFTKPVHKTTINTFIAWYNHYHLV